MIATVILEDGSDANNYLPDRSTSPRDLRHADYAAVRIPWKLNGGASEFGWLRSGATKGFLLSAVDETVRRTEFRTV